ncbi:MAG: 6-pyruvoyl trahydropterin synthase family protein [Methyloligellaceae bacterium]
MAKYTVTRKLEIDAAHRITTHGSQCRHIHGHRYVIEVTCEAEMLNTTGTETDMVLDFSFIKQEMVRQIEGPCDHGFILSLHDDELLQRLSPEGTNWQAWKAELSEAVDGNGYCSTTNAYMETRLYIVPFQSTAECLARHWYQRLSPAINGVNGSNVKVKSVTVWETPNCFAVYQED